MKRPSKGKDIVLSPFAIEIVDSTRDSIASRIVKWALKALSEHDILSQKQLVQEILSKDPTVGALYKDVDYSYFRRIFQRMVREGLIVKVRIFGDNKRVYYMLPKTLEKYKDKVVKPKA